MNQSDQELLDKQLRGLYPPPRRDGMLIMTIVAVFFGGLVAWQPVVWAQRADAHRIE